MRVTVFALAFILFNVVSIFAADGWQPLFNGKNLDGWEVIGDGVWLVMQDGTLVGERRPSKDNPVPGSATITRAQYNGWRDQQSWLYTRQDFGEFDLHLSFWTRVMGNSGVSIRDSSRARYSITIPPDYTRTPSKIGYEIQINSQYPDPHPTGSIYGSWMQRRALRKTTSGTRWISNRGTLRSASD